MAKLAIEKFEATPTDMQENTKARLRESRLLAPSGYGVEFTQPSHRLFLHDCKFLETKIRSNFPLKSTLCLPSSCTRLFPHFCHILTNDAKPNSESQNGRERESGVRIGSGFDLHSSGESGEWKRSRFSEI